MRFYFFAFLLCFSFSLQAQFDTSDEAKKKVLQDRYMAWLTYKDHSPEIDSDGDVKFSHNDKTYYITIDMKEPEFFRIAKLANLALDSQSEIDEAIKICHEVTKEVKVTKVYWINNVIWTSSELLLSDPGSHEQIFERALKLTESAYNKFVSAWSERNN